MTISQSLAIVYHTVCISLRFKRSRRIFSPSPGSFPVFFTWHTPRCENEKLINLLCGELYHLVRMYRYQSSRIASRPQKALAQHRQILESIAVRDEELAEILMRRHISGAQKNIALQLENKKGSNAIIEEKQT